MITWKVVQMHLYPQHQEKPDVVFNVTWRCEAQDQGYMAWMSDNAQLSISEDSFIPYEDLTEEAVLGWVWSVINKTEVESKVQTEVEKLINPPVIVKTLPWNITPPQLEPTPEPAPEPAPEPIPEPAPDQEQTNN